MALFYKWIPSSTACERCLQLAQEPHNSPPQKPHRDCACTWIQINTNDTNPKNCSGDPMILRIATTNEGRPTVENGVIVSLHLTYEVTGICPDNTIITINLAITIEGSENVAKTRKSVMDRAEELDSLKDAAAEEMDKHLDEVRQEAMSVLKSECQPCMPRPSV